MRHIYYLPLPLLVCPINDARLGIFQEGMVRRPLYLNSPPRERDPEHVAIKIVRNNDTMNGDDCGCHHQRRPAPEQRPDGALWLPKDPCHTHADPTVLSPDTTIETHRAPHLTAPRPGLLA
jgi:hypothetical protein